MVDEHLAIAAIADECSAQQAHVVGCCHPTGGLGINLARSLQLPVLRFIEQIDSHRNGSLDNTACRLVLLARVQCFAVRALAPATRRALRRATTEEALSAGLVEAEHFRLTGRRFHRSERRERGRTLFEPCQQRFPRVPFMSIPVFLEPAFQQTQQIVPFLRFHGHDGVLKEGDSLWDSLRNE